VSGATAIEAERLQDPGLEWLEADGLGAAQAGGVDELDEGPVAQRERAVPRELRQRGLDLRGLGTVRMQRALASADPDLPFSGFYRMNDLMAATLATQRVQVALLGRH